MSADLTAWDDIVFVCAKHPQAPLMLHAYNPDAFVCVSKAMCETELTLDERLKAIAYLQKLTDEADAQGIELHLLNHKWRTRSCNFQVIAESNGKLTVSVQMRFA